MRLRTSQTTTTSAMTESDKEEGKALLPPNRKKNMGSSDTKAIDQWSRKEKENKKQQENQDLRARLEEETHPKRTALHNVFVLISAIAGLSAFLMCIGQIVGIRYKDTTLLQYVIRTYVVFMCILAVLVELEWTKMVKDSSILKYWITRGIFYAFIGVLGLEQNDAYALRQAAAAATTDEESSSSTGVSAVTLKFIQVVAWLMVGVGVLYFVMGALCLQIVYNRVRQTYQERLERAVTIRDTTSRYMEHVV